MLNGFLILNKESNYTSNDCIIILRKILNIKKIGYIGTLDPNAIGVLPICIGKATKLINYIENNIKIYIAEICLGISTDTEDIWGNVIKRKKINFIFDAKIDLILSIIKGFLKQIPPMYSAIKINGKKLYEYARKNKKIFRKKRIVRIYSCCRIGKSKFCKKNLVQKCKIKILCNKGVYIRSLFVEIGKILNVPACLSKLIRINSCGFNILNSLNIKEIKLLKYNNKLFNNIIPIENIKFNLFYKKISFDIYKKVILGIDLNLKELNFKKQKYEKILLFFNSKIIGIYKKSFKNNNLYKAYKILK